MQGMENALDPGTIFYIRIQFRSSDHWERKRIILVGFDADSDPIFLKIASLKPFADYHTLKVAQYPDALYYDSYVECGNIHVKICTRQDFLANVKEFPDSVCGKLLEEDRIQIIRRVCASRTVSPIHQQLIADNLS